MVCYLVRKEIKDIDFEELIMKIVYIFLLVLLTTCATNFSGSNRTRIDKLASLFVTEVSEKVPENSSVAVLNIQEISFDKHFKPNMNIQASAEIVEVTINDLNIWKSIAKDQSLARINKGTRLEVVNKNTVGWVLVKYNNVSGYVDSKYVSVVNVPSQSQKYRTNTSPYISLENAKTLFFLDLLTTKLVNFGKFDIVDRTSLDAVRQEIQFSLSGEVSDNTAISIGKFLGASVVITGAITEAAGADYLRIKALDVNTGKIFAMIYGKI
jgi:curli biogenesis system outer membrane secretion channel CsgG